MIRCAGCYLPHVFAQEMRRILAYRADFWIQFAGGLLAQFAVAWFLWKAVFTYQNTNEIGEYTFSSMMLYYLLVPIIGRAVRGSEMGGISHEIYEGTLNRYIIYPVSFFAFKLTAHLAHTLLFLCQGALALAVFLFITGGSGSSMSLQQIMMALIATLTGATLHFIMVSTIELIAFWADNVWSLVVIVRFTTGLLGGGMIPLTLFPEWMQPVLYKLPFAYFMNVPVRCLMGDMTVVELAGGLGWASAWILCCSMLYRFFWNRGKYRYAGVGI